MDLITQKQIAYILALLKKQGMEAHLLTLIKNFSNDRADHISELYKAEANALIQQLTTGKEDACNIMRRKIISMAREMGWTVVAEVDEHPLYKYSAGYEKYLKADMERIENWCLKNSYLQKNLNSYTFEELPKLVSQFRIVLNKFLNELSN